jgi:transposase
MQARMAGEARLRQSYIGRAFTAPDGLYPEGGIEKGFDALKASDPIIKALRAEEAKRERELQKALSELPVYTDLFKPIEGAGPKISARIIAAVIDIRRFESAAKLKAFMGVHVLPDGTFARRRSGQVANWSGDARQALYLLAEQFNRRPDSHWGQYFRQMKKTLRQIHPVPVVVEVPNSKGGTKKVTRYTDGHIHKMASWRTLTRFVEWLYDEWSDLEEPAQELLKAA